ncbi:uncharacterized protein LOC135475876 [Liolophura sinensis]|uniref:uncharacterized protein LOC135475876 n=1 Tax=Liolophura sinensis TaxID=3198878 RepID=UPI0031582401
MSDDILYRVITEADVDEVIRLMDEDFFKEEIIAKSLGFETPRETKAYYDTMMGVFVDSKLSVVAVDSSQAKIVGVILNLVSTPDNPNEFSFDTDDKDTSKLATMDKVYDPVYDDVDFYQLYDTSILVANRVLCVSKSHRRKGIAMGLIRSTLEKIRSQGIPCYVVEATSAYTRIMMERLNFDKISEKPYTELLVNGQQIVTDTSVHKSVSLHAKRL